MNIIRRIILWFTMVFIILLFIFSVFGAFLGSVRAKAFFNSIPLAVYWILLILLLALGILLFKRLRNVPALMMMHVGCIFVLAGAIWGSQAGHKLQKKLFKIDKIPTGFMRVYESGWDNRVYEGNVLIGELPFDVALEDFRIEYYKPAALYFQIKGGDMLPIEAEIGAEFSLGPEIGRIKIVREFENFKMEMEDEGVIVYDDPGYGSNPALEVQLINPAGKEFTRYVFSPSLPDMYMHLYPDDGIYMIYNKTISDYISELQIIETTENNGQREIQVLAEKDIEVNHPLHYGGYHFYQMDYDHEYEQYTVLQVVSDSGLFAVFAGYLMLCLGICWHFWLRRYSGKTK